MRICLAAAEARTAMDACVWAGAPNILCSFEYLQKKSDKGIATLQRANAADMFILVDSGVFTWKQRLRSMNLVYYTRDWLPYPTPQCPPGRKRKRAEDREQWPITIAEDLEPLKPPFEDFGSQWGQMREWAKTRLRAYKEEYFSFLKKAAPYANAFAELDCEWIIEEEIWEWREEQAEILKKYGNGAEVIMTPHLYLDEKSIRRIAEYTSYIGTDTAEDSHPYWTSLKPVLEELKIRVHGWAMTNNEAIKRIPFFSVDSSTWLGGARYGTTYWYKGGYEMATLPYTDKELYRSRMTAFCKDHGIDWELLMKDDLTQINRFNAKQWAVYSEELLKDNSRAYWLSEDQRADEVSRQRGELGLNNAMIVRHSTDQLPIKQAPAHGHARMCNTCFLNTKCPAFQKDASCSVDMPLEMGKDPEDFLKRMIEVQGQRVMFGAFAERIQGGVIDPALSKEMDLLFKITKMATDLNTATQSESVTITAKKTNGGAGVISQIFGGYGRSGGGGSKPSQSEKIVDINPVNED